MDLLWQQVLIQQNSNEPKRTRSSFDIDMETYKYFVSKVEKADFANAYTRYITELNLLKPLSEKAKAEGKTKESAQLSDRITEVETILKKQFGISIK